MSSSGTRHSLFLLLLISFAFVSFGQTVTSGTVVGSVTDSSGAIVPDAAVTIRQADTGTVRTTKTTAAGQYRFPFLKPGEYSITAEATGQTASVPSFSLLVGQEQQINLVLAVQSVQQSVYVNSSSTLLETENANQATSYSEKEVANMPVNGGDITNIAFTTPGLRLNVGGGNTNFNVNGLPFSSALFTVNGADINEPYNLNNKSGASNNTLGANDIQEAAVVLNAFSAQYGRMAGAQVNYITKSGTNEFHGNLAENYNDAVFNANDYFKNLEGTPRGRAVANQYAASIGGPILKNKLTFFANTEGLRYALPSSGVVSLPSPQFQQYTLAHIPADSVPYYQDLFKLYNNAPGVNRAVPVTNGNGPEQDNTGHLGCGVQTFSGTYVNGSSGPRFGSDVPCAVAFGTNASSLNTETYVSGRVDYNISDRQKIYFRLSRDWGIQASATSPISPTFNQQSNQPWTIPQVNYTYTITPTLVNNFIASGNWYSAVFGVVNFPDAQTAFPGNITFNDGGANGSANNTTGTGFANVNALLPTGRRGEQFELIDDVSWSRGHHTIQAGVNDRNNRISDSSISSGSIIGAYTFNDLTDFATGAVNSTSTGSKFTQSFPLLSTVHTRLNSLGFYGQDEWSARKNLNITYGVRFELQGNPSCKENCYSRFNTEFLASGYQAGAGVPYNTTIQTGLHKNFASLEGVVTEPRLGVAWSPRGEGGIVIRGGVGLFANTFPGSIAASVFGNAPNKFTPTVSYGDVALNNDPSSSQSVAIASDLAFRNGFTAGDDLNQLQAALGSVKFATPAFYVNPNHFSTIKVLEWSLELEQPLGRRDVFVLSYSGNHGYDESVNNSDANAYIGTPSRYPNGFGALPSAIPDPRFSTVSQILTSGYSNYDGFTALVRHALSYGFQGQASYTWSHALQLEPLTGTATTFYVYNPYNLRAGYGPTGFDTRNNFTADFLWVTPREKNRWLQAGLGGWTLGSKLYVYSGRPFSVTNSKIPGGLSTTFGGPVLADLLEQNLAGKHCSRAAVTTPCFSSTQFATYQATAANPNQQTDFGNTPPNDFRGPGFFSVASQLTKRIPIHERVAFEAGATAYNLFNHANFAVPTGNVASGLGLITSTVSSPTSIYGTGQGAIVSGRVLVLLGKFTF
ncbi:TonB-dependent receptor [Paracidobacterium acidisoli]|uniref:Carboxypeptidase regulatory-like domain-containing protein n=1 Tax=Paracidobacterium acidisoli TaxID=2303751 RepID=A0A372IJ20_9BACT|nr:carboxypeptidase regulatory-like domain-containing protein [Paracidobacterium acidisoli]MBT9333166.1 carboxypeptidase regulatory-like domain-containing protein [Paracidobacterium acidisoli]